MYYVPAITLLLCLYSFNSPKLVIIILIYKEKTEPQRE